MAWKTWKLFYIIVTILVQVHNCKTLEYKNENTFGQKLLFDPMQYQILDTASADRAFHHVSGKIHCIAIRCAVTNIITSNDLFCNGLKNVSKDATKICLQVQNSFENTTLDFCQLARFEHLEILRIWPEQGTRHHRIDLAYTANGTNCLANLTNLSELHINLAISDRDYSQLLSVLPQLDLLDLSYTHTISFHNLSNTLNGINTERLSYLYLRRFQFSGEFGSNGYLDNLPDLIGYNTSLLELDLSANGLLRISNGIFTAAPKLRFFDISDNFLLANANLPIILESLFHPTLEYFNFNFQSSCRRKTSLANTSLPQQLGESYHFPWPISLLKCWNKVTIGNITNLFLYTDVFCGLLNCGEKGNFTIDCRLLPNMSDIYDPNCFFFMHLPIGQNLKTILANKFGENYGYLQSIYSFEAKHMCFRKSSLDVFRLSHNKEFVQNLFTHPWNVGVFPTVKGLENLTEIDLSGNGIQIVMSEIIESFPQIESFILSENTVNISSTFSLCSPTFQNIKKIDLSRATIMSHMDRNTIHNDLRDASDFSKSSCGHRSRKLPINFFEECKNLSLIQLSACDLCAEDTAFYLNQSSELKVINFSYNAIDVLPKQTRVQLDLVAETRAKQNESIVVDLTGNLMRCDCSDESLEFLEWIQKTRVTFYHKHDYECTGIEGNLFMFSVNLKWLTKTCSHWIIIVESVVGTLSGVLGIVTLILTFKKRWRIRYWMFNARRCMSRVYRRIIPVKSQTELQSKKWRFDAYVCYCAEDRMWVHNVLMKELEEKYGFKLCIHYRDFPIGGIIYSTIEDFMNESREIIMVISDRFLQKPMCQHEVLMGKNLCLTRGKRIIIIKSDDLSSDCVEGENDIAELLTNHTYLEWIRTNADGQKLFWRKLVATMYGEETGESCLEYCCPCGPRYINYTHVDRFTSPAASTDQTRNLTTDSVPI